MNIKHYKYMVLTVATILFGVVATLIIHHETLFINDGIVSKIAGLVFLLAGVAIFLYEPRSNIKKPIANKVSNDSK